MAWLCIDGQSAINDLWEAHVITSQAAASVPRPVAHHGNSACTCSTDMPILDSSFSEMHFFVESLKLYELMNETLLMLYNPASREDLNDDPYTPYFGSLGAKAAGNVLEMDRKFWLWSRELPAQFQYNRNMKEALIHERQTNVLWLRYWHVQILLFRPILSSFCSLSGKVDQSMESPMVWNTAFQFSISCVKIALETIEFFSFKMEGRLQEELDDILPAW